MFTQTAMQAFRSVLVGFIDYALFFPDALPWKRIWLMPAF